MNLMWHKKEAKKFIFEYGDISLVYSKGKLETKYDHHRNPYQHLSYQLSILIRKRRVFKTQTTAHPKVEELLSKISDFTSHQTSDMWNYYSNPQAQILTHSYYDQVVVDDSWNIDYGYKLERYVDETYSSSSSVYPRVKFDEYTLTVFEMENNHGYANTVENFGKAVILRKMKERDVLRLQSTLQEFINYVKGG